MRDRLDGIHTKQGRVVYDREKHGFTDRDVLRILKKINSREDSRGGVFSCDMVSEYLYHLIKKTENIYNDAVRAECRGALEFVAGWCTAFIRANGGSVNWGGGTFGGGGAVRTF